MALQLGNSMGRISPQMPALRRACHPSAQGFGGEDSIGLKNIFLQPGMELLASIGGPSFHPGCL